MGRMIGDGIDHKVICLNAVNHDPGETTIETIHCRIREGWSWMRLRWKWKYGLLNPLDDPFQTTVTRGPAGGGLPKLLKVGERHNYYLIARHESLKDRNITDVGFIDIFGGSIWADRSSTKRVRIDVKKTFEVKHSTENYLN